MLATNNLSQTGFLCRAFGDSASGGGGGAMKNVSSSFQKTRQKRGAVPLKQNKCGKNDGY